jgi:hypothetical protein
MIRPGQKKSLSHESGWAEKEDEPARKTERKAEGGEK